METTSVSWGYIGIMEKMETTGIIWGLYGIALQELHLIRATTAKAKEQLHLFRVLRLAAT